MPIITHTKDYQAPVEALYNLWPDQFISDSKKKSDDWMKINMDYFYGIAILQYSKNRDTFAYNYEFVKGNLRKQDFYEQPEVKGMVDLILKDTELPDYIQQYSILNPPLNTMLGEMTKRPDNSRVKAFDDDSKSEELAFKTDILNQYIMQKVQSRIYQRMIQQGYDLQDPQTQEQYNQITEEQLTEYLTSYTSQAEKWGNRILEALKLEFNFKELSEEAFRDLLISARERYHISEDNSKLGFKVEVVNPKNTWYLSTPDKKYLKDAYAAGIIEVMEISEIINRYPLTKEEIDHLKRINKESYLVDVRESNLFSGKTGQESIIYDTYDPLVLKTRLQLESQLIEDSSKGELDNYLGIINNVGVYGQKFVVVTAYWESKKKIGKLTFINEDNIEETVLVDENYKSGQHPRQLDLEWGWVNQWYKGLKIGADIYYVEPLKILDYCPIIGVDFEKKNTEAKSLIDLIKPYQVIYNICLNQLFSLLQKEIGVIYNVNLRKIPKPDDVDYEDAIQVWYDEAIARGVSFYDDSPENMKVVGGNNTDISRVDLTRTAEIQSRISLAEWAKAQAWELVGINRQRLGGVLATETATGTQAALNASYAQTEPWFVQHEYIQNQVYQATLDAAQYIESQKPLSTISYISNEGEHAFIEINGSELKLRDLRVYVTSRAEDQRIFQEFRQLAQPMLQNGASLEAVATLFSTNSVREMKDVMKRVSQKAEQFQQQQLQIQQQQIQAQQETAQMQIQSQMQKDAETRAFEGYQKDLDRLNKVQVATIQAAAKNQGVLSDSNNSGLADSIEITRMNNDILSANRNYEIENQRIQAEYQNQQNKMINEQSKIDYQKQKDEADRKLKEEELRIKEKQIDTQKQIAIKNKNQYDK